MALINYKIVALLFILLIMVPLLIHYHISKIPNENFSSNFLQQRMETNYNLDTINKINSVSFRLKELLRIRGSVGNELKNLEYKRQKLRSEISTLSSKLDEVRSLLIKKQLELKRVHISIEQAEKSKQEVLMQNQPFIARPMRIFSNNHEENFIINEWQKCSMSTCFDYSRCSITSGFPVYFYPFESEDELSQTILEALKKNVYTTLNYSIACIFIVFITTRNNINLDELPHWSKGNHVLINLDSRRDLNDLVGSYKSMLMQSRFDARYRQDFDAVIPSIEMPPSNILFGSHCPAKRKYFAVYQHVASGDEAEMAWKFLKSVQDMSPDKLRFGSEDIKSDILRQSTFALLLTVEEKFVVDPFFVKKIIEMIIAGSIPVLIEKQKMYLPFDQMIDWNLATIRIPISRVSEIYFILNTFGDSDIIQLRRQGRLLYDRYLSSPYSVIETIISFIRHRVGIAPLPLSVDQSRHLLNSSSMKFYNAEFVPNIDTSEPAENLGPIEPLFSSLTYQRNHSLALCYGYQMWNTFKFNPFYLYPSTPFDPVLPSEAKFIGSNYGFRPIGGGSGGAGKEFSESLGGNWPREQFTIVILTYEREAVLIDSLQRLKGLPHLNKIIVIWNNPHQMPSMDLKWPDVGVSIEIIKSKKNSLNNRFKPYQEIETDAILSMDDDAHLRHDEIIFGFRVWREARDRIVGFPGRYHAWDSEHSVWHYNSNYSCELSMVLTGAAFFHKHYTYLYTFSMDKLIREKVDEFMNCEDIAMNFLVSHITRKPPLKVTSRWTFRCPGCPVSLSEDDSHFQERHKCINYFSYVYGYNPLLNTQFRADSVLFKTRLPHDKQKCFKFI